MVQSTVAAAKALNRERVQFEVAGGNYRLVVAFDLLRQFAFVKFIARVRSTTLSMALRYRKFEEAPMDIRPIRTDGDHRVALAEIEACWGASERSEAGIARCAGRAGEEL